jgi:quercetin dioxygenase-like cupin family protein
MTPDDARLLVSRLDDGSDWGSDWRVGRVGMLYRDLVPGRLGGRLIASHIRIPAGGPVGDYVHYHDVAFQLIFVWGGWVRVVYEDQGPPFVLRAGDAVLQPPQIRHRVLECSDGLEVVEVTAPADHVTHADEVLELPTAQVRAEREFGGQRFVRHAAEAAGWTARPPSPFAQRDLGIRDATRGRADAVVVRIDGGAEFDWQRASTPNDVEFWFVVSGGLSLSQAGVPQTPVELRAGDAITLPSGPHRSAVVRQDGAELLIVSVSAPLLQGQSLRGGGDR